MRQLINRTELLQVQGALLVAIGLQLITRQVGSELLPGSQYILIFTELVLAVLIGFTVNRPHDRNWGLHRIFAFSLLGLITIANISGLIFVLYSLVVGHGVIEASALLASAIAIFLTNIIVFALWYWEIDSPGLSRTLWSKHDKDFQFTQQDMVAEFPDWRPQFADYLFISVINAFNGASTSAKPLTHQAKMLMAAQAGVSIFTLALLIARSVSILGS